MKQRSVSCLENEEDVFHEIVSRWAYKGVNCYCHS